MKTNEANDFLSADYEVPEGPTAYMKFKPGENRFRVLASPLLGYIYWVNKDGEPRQSDDKPAKGDKPVRKRMNENVPSSAGGATKHFWALPIFNYDSNSIQVLEITQKSIQNSIKNLSRSKNWGSPLNYDLAVTRTGEGLETEYSVLPEPKTELPKEVTELWQSLLDAGFDMERLFSGGHPHPENVAISLGAPLPSNDAEGELNLDDIPM